MTSRTVTATRENRTARPNPRPAPVRTDHTHTMAVSPMTPGTPRTRRPSTIAETGVTGLQWPPPVPPRSVPPSPMASLLSGLILHSTV